MSVPKSPTYSPNSFPTPRQVDDRVSVSMDCVISLMCDEKVVPTESQTMCPPEVSTYIVPLANSHVAPVATI